MKPTLRTAVALLAGVATTCGSYALADDLVVPRDDTVHLRNEGMLTWNVTRFDTVEGKTQVRVANGPMVPLEVALEPGDTVMLIQSRGRPGETANVGNYEFFAVREVSAPFVLFQRLKRHNYGNDGGDARVGTGDDQHRVQLIRVPAFDDVTLRNNATLTASAWDGTQGGVLVMRVLGTLHLTQGTIDMAGKGYLPAFHSSVYQNQTGTQGESIEGPGIRSRNRRSNGGGGGEGGMDGGCGGGGGAFNAGQAGETIGDGFGRSGDGGANLQAASRLFFGGAGGEGGADEDGDYPGRGGTGGGIVVLLTNGEPDLDGRHIDVRGSDGTFGRSPQFRCGMGGGGGERGVT